MKKLRDNSVIDFFDRHLLLLWACLLGGNGFLVSRNAMNTGNHSSAEVDRYGADGGLYIVAAVGFFFAWSQIEGLRGRIHKLENKPAPVAEPLILLSDK